VIDRLRKNQNSLEKRNNLRTYLVLAGVQRTAPQFCGWKFMDAGALAVPIAGVRFGHEPTFAAAPICGYHRGPHSSAVPYHATAIGSISDGLLFLTLPIEEEIRAGTPENVVQTVTVNSRTLKLTSHGFEEE